MLENLAESEIILTIFANPLRSVNSEMVSNFCGRKTLTTISRGNKQIPYSALISHNYIMPHQEGSKHIFIFEDDQA